MIAVTVFDKVAGTWSNPVVVQNSESAKRDFRTACSNDTMIMGKHPEDFQLFAVGDWHVSEDPTKDPQLVSYDKPKFLIAGVSSDEQA